MSYAYSWEFIVAPECRAAFIADYGPDGAWSRLFRRHPGYLDTLLLSDRDHPDRFVSIDRWISAEAFAEFHRESGAAYVQLDRQFENLTLSERFLGAFSEVGRPR